MTQAFNLSQLDNKLDSSGHLDAADFVLQNFSNIEKKSLQDLIIKAGDAVESIMRSGLERTQQEFNE